ncbi:MAG: sigma-70 family RNA polymerase sigma factor [Candidatus Bipolaricaulaceae bacterium]
MEEELQELARALRVRDDPGLQAELLRRGEGLVRAVAAEFGATGLSQAELVRAGHLGLLSAVYNIHLDKKGDFPAFAANLIRGEIRAHIRRRFPPPRAPRWLVLLGGQIDRAHRELTARLDRPPTLSELAERLNLTDGGLREVFKAREAFLYTSISAERRSEDVRPEFLLAAIQDRRPSSFPWPARIRLAQAVDRLADLWERASRALVEGGGE